MNRQEFLTGTILYALIIGAGFTGPILKKLSKLPWDRPIGSFAWHPIQPPINLTKLRVGKTEIDSRIHQILESGPSISDPISTVDGIHQKLEENWEKLASHQGIIGPGEVTPKNATPLLGIKKVLNSKPIPSGIQGSHFEESTKG